MSGDSKWAKWILGKKQERENLFKVTFSSIIWIVYFQKERNIQSF